MMAVVIAFVIVIVSISSIIILMKNSYDTFLNESSIIFWRSAGIYLFKLIMIFITYKYSILLVTIFVFYGLKYTERSHMRERGRLFGKLLRVHIPYIHFIEKYLSEYLLKQLITLLDIICGFFEGLEGNEQLVFIEPLKETVEPLKETIEPLHKINEPVYNQDNMNDNHTIQYDQLEQLETINLEPSYTFDYFRRPIPDISDHEDLVIIDTEIDSSQNDLNDNINQDSDSQDEITLDENNKNNKDNKDMNDLSYSYSSNNIPNNMNTIEENEEFIREARMLYDLKKSLNKMCDISDDENDIDVNVNVDVDVDVNVDNYDKCDIISSESPINRFGDTTYNDNDNDNNNDNDNKSSNKSSNKASNKASKKSSKKSSNKAPKKSSKKSLNSNKVELKGNKVKITINKNK